jgi:hypothetical protein
MPVTVRKELLHLGLKNVKIILKQQSEVENLCTTFCQFVCNVPVQLEVLNTLSCFSKNS